MKKLMMISLLLMVAVFQSAFAQDCDPFQSEKCSNKEWKIRYITLAQFPNCKIKVQFTEKQCIINGEIKLITALVSVNWISNDPGCQDIEKYIKDKSGNVVEQKLDWIWDAIYYELSRVRIKEIYQSPLPEDQKKLECPNSIVSITGVEYACCSWSRTKAYKTPDGYIDEGSFVKINCNEKKCCVQTTKYCVVRGSDPIEIETTDVGVSEGDVQCKIDYPDVDPKFYETIGKCHANCVRHKITDQMPY